ncbi:MAG: enoyl-CoA hydratase/isomerase family protein [Oceanicoccus sp.]
MTELVKVEQHGGVGELVLNRPQQRNSLIGPLVWELTEGLQILMADTDCHVIVIRGAEGYFCAGLDLKAFSADPVPEWKSEFQQDWMNFHRQVFACDKPIIGALEGFAIAGGSALAFSCDFLVVGETSFLHVAEVERGMMAPINIFWLSVRYSYQLALKMALLGERHYGAELVRLGVADRCVADAEVVTVARAMAARFCEFDTGNTQLLKRATRCAAVSPDPEKAFDLILATFS